MAVVGLIIAGAAMVAASGVGVVTTDADNMKEVESMSDEKIAARTLLDLATRLYKDSNGSDPEFYKRVFEGLPETKMGADDRQRLAKTYDEISLLANQKAIQQAGQAFGENMDDLVRRGVMTPAQADKQKLQNEARVRAMMSVLDKRWQATEIADARKMWVGDQGSTARGVGILAGVRQKNQMLMNSAIDGGLRNALRRAEIAQDIQTKQFWANEKNAIEANQAKWRFWTNFFLPGGGGGGGGGNQGYDMPAGADAGSGYSTSNNYMNDYGAGRGSGSGYQYTVPDSYGSYAGSGYYSGGGGYMG